MAGRLQGVCRALLAPLSLTLCSPVPAPVPVCRRSLFQSRSRTTRGHRGRCDGPGSQAGQQAQGHWRQPFPPLPAARRDCISLQHPEENSCGSRQQTLIKLFHFVSKINTFCLGKKTFLGIPLLQKISEFWLSTQRRNERKAGTPGRATSPRGRDAAARCAWLRAELREEPQVSSGKQGKYGQERCSKGVLVTE